MQTSQKSITDWESVLMKNSSRRCGNLRQNGFKSVGEQFPEQNKLAISFDDFDESDGLSEQNEKREGQFDSKVENVIQIDEKVEETNDGNQVKKEKTEPHTKYSRIVLDANTLEELKQFFKKYHLTEKSAYTHSYISLRKYAQMKNLGNRSIYHLYNEWLKDPLLTSRALACKYKSQLTKIPRKCTSARVKQIMRMIEHNPLLSTEEIANELMCFEKCHTKKRDGRIAKINFSAVTRIFRQFKLKKVRIGLISSFRNEPSDILARDQFAAELTKFIDSDAKLFYFDEMILNRWVCCDRVWVMQDQQISNVMANLRDESSLLVTLMDYQGKIVYQLVNGSTPTINYLEIAESLLLKLNQVTGKEKKILVVSSAANKGVQDVAAELGKKYSFYVIKIPAFSGFLNPLQYWFVQIRNALTQHKFQSNRELMRAVDKVLGHSVMSFFPNIKEHILYSLGSCLKARTQFDFF